VLEEERKMLTFARRGRGTCHSLGDGREHVFTGKKPTADQRKAVEHVLSCTDRVILIRGAAGVGKTFMMRNAVAGIEGNGTKVFTFAPSSEASRGVLRGEGFADADTVARLLVDQEMQERVRGQVIWVDEAGLLGAKATADLFRLAEEADARVILSGDRYQHGSVERGSPLRLLETEAGLVPAEIREIQRQKGNYKQAVEALSEGRTVDGFQQLDNMGWIKESPDTERYKAMAGEYVAAVAEGTTALVVSPTHLEGDKITAEIRSELRRLGKLETGERSFLSLQNANLTEGERADLPSYQPGDVIAFHQNAKGFEKGERLTLAAVAEGEKAGELNVPVSEAKRFQAFHAGSIDLAPGDLVRITQNGKGVDGRRLNNGATYTVRGFDANGDIVLSGGHTVAKDFGHLAYGYTVTSHAAQGRSVERVIVGQSSWSFPASSREQFYVSASRGQEQLTVYTDDKEALLEAIDHSDDRLTATELTTGRDHRGRASGLARMSRSADAQRQSRQPQRPRHPEREEVGHDR
jgi:ATP-dependent exoDNAse (exonuclease V) alpha subunit